MNREYSAHTGGCYGQAEAGPAIGSQIRPGAILPPGALTGAGLNNAINKPPELDLIRKVLMEVCEQAHNVQHRTRSVGDRLFGPLIEKLPAETDHPVGEGPAIHAIFSLINEVRKQLNTAQAELARLEAL